MARHERGDERRGADDDGDAPSGPEKKVQIENSYFEKLKMRLGQQPTAEPESATAEPKKPGFVIYGDDGRPIG